MGDDNTGPQDGSRPTGSNRPAGRGSRPGSGFGGGRDGRDSRGGRAGGDRLYRSNDDRGPRQGGDRPYRGRDDRPAREGGDRPYRSNDDRGPRQGGDRPYGREGQGRGDRRPDQMRRGGASHGGPARQGSRPDGGKEYGQGNRAWREDRDRFDDRGPRPQYEREPAPPGLARAADEPPVPVDADLSRLPREVRAELRSLSSEAAEFVSKHLVAAGDLVDTDSALALRHAQAAKRRGARLPLVREALAETAYAAEDYAVALNEYRALRRMTGDTAYYPVMADCERALGKPEEALRIIREAKLADLTKRTHVELVLVEAGVREDVGQVKEGLRTLRVALGQATRDMPQDVHARLAYAYAAMLVRHGEEDQAREWFATADRLDVARELDAADQLEALDGVDYEFDFSEEEEADDEDVAVDEEDPEADDEDDADEEYDDEEDAEEDDADEEDAEEDDADEEDAEEVEEAGLVTSGDGSPEQTLSETPVPVEDIDQDQVEALPSEPAVPAADPSPEAGDPATAEQKDGND